MQGQRGMKGTTTYAHDVRRELAPAKTPTLSTQERSTLRELYRHAVGHPSLWREVNGMPHPRALHGLVLARLAKTDRDGRARITLAGLIAARAS